MNRKNKMRRKEGRDYCLALSFNKKELRIAFILSILFIAITGLHVSYSIDPSGWAGSVLDPIIDGGSEYSSSIASELADAFIQLLSLSFSPNFFTLMGTEHPTLIYGTVTKQAVKESYFFSTVFGLGQMLGVIIATILFFVNIIMLVIGKENKIRDNPIVLFIRYIVSGTAVYLAFDIVYSVIMCIDEIWSQFVFRGYTNIYAGQSFYQTEVSRIFTQDPNTGNVVVWGAMLNVPINGIWKAVVSCVGILIIWKLIKSVFRLYMEVAERYFVLMVLCAFFPVAVATYTCNTTKNIFFSYLRMFFCQAFVMLANIAFMKFFLFVLFSGGWLASLTNYICALAFVRVAQRLDSYMMAMGLNVAQTGTGILGAIGGAGMGFANMFRGANNARKNIGKSLIGMGISNNNAQMFNAGAVAGFSGDTLVRGLVPTTTSFENAVVRYSGINAQGFTASKEADNIPVNASTSSPVESDAWLRQTLKENGIPTTDIDKLQKLGIDPGSIVRVEKDQRTGAVGYNDEKGAVATSYKGNMFSNNWRDQEMEFNAKQADISQNRDTEIGPDQSMSEADATRIADGINDFNTDVSHVKLETLNSLYAGDYDSLEPIPVSRREQSEMLKNGDDSVNVTPYGMDAVGHSRMQFRGRYMDQSTPKSDDFFVDMYNIAQHPELLKNQGQVGWHFVRQGNEGFMVHDSRHTADDRPSVVGKVSPHYQKAKPDLQHPDNHIASKKPSVDTPTEPTKTDQSVKTNTTNNPINDKDTRTSARIEPAPVEPDIETYAFSATTSPEMAYGPDPNLSRTSTSTVYTTVMEESVDDVYNRIYGSDTESSGGLYEPELPFSGKDRAKAAERHESTKKEKELKNKRNSENPRSGNKPGKASKKSGRHVNNKNIPVDFDDY